MQPKKAANQLLKVVDVSPVYHEARADAPTIAVAKAWDQIANSLKVFDGKPSFSAVPLRQICHHLHQLDCGFVAAAYPFRDDDFLADWMSHSGRAFRRHDRDCVRLHFFSRNSGLSATKNHRAIVDAIHEVGNQPVDEHGRPKYLGFMVVRPTGERCIGRTILASPHYYNPTRHIHVRATYHANLLGARLPVVGCPFMQQDGVGHVCASVALWSLCYDLHRRYHTPRVDPCEITEIATAYEPRSAFDWGLSPRQMSQVLREVGCGNDVQTVKLDWDWKSRGDLFRDTIDNLYGYVQSNIPVLLTVWASSADEQNGHTVLVMGHDIRQSQAHERRDEPGSGNDSALFGHGLWNSEYVSEFYSQDDVRGPYSPVHIWSDSKEWRPPQGTAPWTDDTPIVLQYASRIVVQPAITRHAVMTYRHARRLIERFFGSSEEWFTKRLEGAQPGRDADLLKALRESLRLAWARYRKRLYLQRSTVFRHQLMDRVSGRRGVGDDTRTALCCLPLPKYLYVCDFCRSVGDETDELELLGEIILDATEPTYVTPKAVVAVRMQHVLAYQLGEQILVNRQEDYADDTPNYAPRSSRAGDAI